MLKRALLGKTLRLFSLLAVCGALAFGALLAGCDNMGGDVGGALLLPAPQGEGGTHGGPNAGLGGTAQGSQVAGTLCARVAIPNLPASVGKKIAARSGADASVSLSGVTGQSFDDGVSKSAFPGADQLAGAAHSMDATLKGVGAGGAEYSAQGEYDSVNSDWIFKFPGAKSASAQNYTLSINLYYTDPSAAPAEKSLVASGRQSVTVAADAPDFGANVHLFPNADSATPGTINLKINFSDASATTAQVQLIDNNDVDVAETYLGGSSVSLSGGAGTIASVIGGVPPGIYTLLMTFKNSSGAALGMRTESLNVFPSLETSAWWTNGAATDELLVDKYGQTEFWVRGEGGDFYTNKFKNAAEAKDTNNGSFAFPLKTIQAAVEKINAIGDTATQYTVYIDGKITGAADANYSSKNYALVNVTGERKILFKGWTGPGTDIVDVNKNTGSAPSSGGRAFYIGPSAQVVLQDLCVTGGYAKGTSDMQGSGGGVYLSGEGNALKNVVIDKNYAANRGGGVYLEQTKSATLDSCVVSENSVDTTGSPTSGIALAQKSGGGIYSIGDLTLKNTNVIKNSARDFGGGICAAGRTTTSAFGVGCKLTMTGGIVGGSDENKNTCHKDGGGIFLEAGTDSIIDGAEISYNLAETKGYGGGISAQGKFTLKNSKLLHNKAECGSSGTMGVGGGISIDMDKEDDANKFATIQNCEISHNQAENGGGGIRFGGCELTLADTIISQNDAGNYSTSYGGGLLIGYNGSTSMAYAATSVKMSGGEISANTAAKGGGVYIVKHASSSSAYAPLVMGGAAKIPAGDDGKNDVFLSALSVNIQVSSPLTAAVPVATITPSSYSPSVQVVKLASPSTATLPDETPKFAVTKNPAAPTVNWEVNAEGKLYKPVRAVYIASEGAGGSDGGDGTIDHPYLSIDKASQAFTEPKAALVEQDGDLPEFKNKIYVLSDMLYEHGAGSSQQAYFEVVGCMDGTVGNPVKFVFNTPNTDDSGIYIQPGQKVKFTNINFTQTADEPNNYAAIIVPPANASAGKPAGEAFLDGCSITGITATKCSAISAEGDVHLKNVSIKNNIAVATSDGAYVWGPAVFSKQGKISLLGKVEICGNKMQVPASGGGTELKPQNVWIGDNKDATVYYEPLVVAGTLASGSQIGVTTYDSSAKVFTSGWSTYNAGKDPAGVFESDAGLEVFKNAGGEAELKKPTSLYVSSTASDPSGDDDVGTGSALKPLASVAKALELIDGYDESSADYTIYIDGTVSGNAYIPDVRAASITIAGTSAASCLDGVDYSDAVVNVATEIPVSLSNLKITRGSHGVMIDAAESGITAASVAISGCVIDGNKTDYDPTCKNGGGIYANTGLLGTLSITDTQISNNSATENGGAIYAVSKVTIGGGVNIPAGAGGKNDVYLKTGVTLALASPLTSTETFVATITPQAYILGTPVVTRAAGSTVTPSLLPAQLAKIAVTPNALSSWSVAADALGTSGVLRAANTATGGVTITLGGGVSFVITKPTATTKTASFKVMDGTDEVAASELSDLQIQILKKTGAVVCSAAAQTVTAAYLPAGDYDLYCSAVYDDIPYDTTVGFEIAESGGGSSSATLATPLTLEAISVSTTVTFKNKASGAVTYKKSDGTSGTIAASFTGSVTLDSAGDKVEFYGDNARYGINNTTADNSNISCDKECYVYGNIMSLVKSSGFESQNAIAQTYAFAHLFYNNSNIKNKPEASLFLPATTLARYCYYYMFNGCSSLTTAPELPAQTLETGCYQYMFFDCSNLSSVTCLAKSVSSTNTTKWLSGVPASGTFVKDPSATWATVGASGIPTGWSVVDYVAP